MLTLSTKELYRGETVLRRPEIEHRTDGASGKRLWCIVCTIYVQPSIDPEEEEEWFLHTDGNWRNGLFIDHIKNITPFWRSYEEAIAALEREPQLPGISELPILLE